MTTKKKRPATDGGEMRCLTPSVQLLSKLGSIAVHVDEMLSVDGHEFDRAALQQLMQDPEVQAWLKDMGPLVPQKRWGK